VTQQLKPDPNHAANADGTDIMSAEEAIKPPLWRRVLLPVSILLLAIGTAILLVVLRPDPPASDPPPIAQLVETMTVQAEPVRYTINSQGTVRPRTETTLVSEVTGKVVKMSDNFVVGGFFNAGEELLRIDQSDYQAALISAEANLASAEATLAEEQARSEQALKDWENLNMVTGREGREPSPLVLRKPQLAQAKASVRASEAALMQARRDLERTSISLPYAGIVRTRSTDIGQFVSVGTNLGSAFAINVAEVRLPLTDEQQSYLILPDSGIQSSADQSAPSVRLSARVGNRRHHWDAHIVRTEGQVDEATRMIYAIATVPDPYGRLGMQRSAPLTIGTFVQAEIDGISADNVIALPRALLREDGTVLIATDSNELAIREVKVDRATAQTAFISAGLNDGDRVVTTAVSSPIPGTPLRMLDSNADDTLMDIENLADAETLNNGSAQTSKAGTDNDQASSI
jgi:RND family efflux transporter MFP subunit